MKKFKDLLKNNETSTAITKFSEKLSDVVNIKTLALFSLCYFLAFRLFEMNF